jgi:hypothetical protein
VNWIAAIVAVLALVFSTRADVASTREATDAGAVEAHWLYRLAGGRWDTLRWVVCAAAVALVVWAAIVGGWVAWATAGAAAVWSGYVFRVAAQNREVAAEMRRRQQASGRSELDKQTSEGGAVRRGGRTISRG